MKNTAFIPFAFSAIAVLGAGCMPGQVSRPQASIPPAPIAPAPSPSTQIDEYEGWGTVTSGGIVSFRIPPGCQGDPGAGTTYIICPTPGNDTPTPEMTISSDGTMVSVRRWEDLESPYWDKVVGSLKVLTPLSQEIQINIDN